MHELMTFMYHVLIKYGNGQLLKKKRNYRLAQVYVKIR